MSETNEPPRIAGPVAHPRRPAEMPVPGAWDTHAHIFGPVDRFPFAPGRGYTPPEAPVEAFIALHDHLGIARGVIVQGNAHGLDNTVVLDALKRFPDRFRGVAITDTRIAPATLREWHRLGMRGLRFHLFPPGGKPTMVRGVGLDVFEVFRPAMRELGWIMQTWCDYRVLIEIGGPAARDRVGDAGRARPHPPHAGGARHQRSRFPDAATAGRGGRGACEAVGALSPVAAIPGLSGRAAVPRGVAARQSGAALWGTDWPHPQIAAELMPDDGQLVDLFHQWTPKIEDRRRILVDTPARLFDRA